MRYLLLAADYDGTLARDGRVDTATVRDLERLRASGRRLVLATGRQLDEVVGLFPEIGLCELVVAENGGLLFDPATGDIRPLAEPPPSEFVTALRARGVTPLAVGHVIVASWTPNETIVVETIRALGLELQVVFNKGAVMVVPSGVNKATGLMAALDRLRISPHNVVAVGDAENDHSMLSLAECSAAVANAVPMLCDVADVALTASHGEGVRELIDELVETDLARRGSPRHALLIGRRRDGSAVTLPSPELALLIAGSSGSGKSTLATGIVERVVADQYQLCLVDPEGDHEAFPQAIVLGGPERIPDVGEVVAALETPQQSVVVSLIGVPLDDRPTFFARLLTRLQELRVATGRPHWILVDEAHHLLPADWQPAPSVVTQHLAGMIYLTVHPDAVSPAALAGVGVVAALGDEPLATLARFAGATGTPLPDATIDVPGRGEALVWRPTSQEPPFLLEIIPGASDRTRHRRKYAEGELPPDRSFYFRGPGNRLNLRARNLRAFTELADGVDGDTWLHHLRLGHYSRWLRDAIKDRELADEVRAIESRPDTSAAESRDLIRAAIDRRYTLPA